MLLNLSDVPSSSIVQRHARDFEYTLFKGEAMDCREKEVELMPSFSPDALPLPKAMPRVNQI